VALAAPEHCRRARLGILHTLAGFFFAPIFGHTLCLRGDSPFIQEPAKPTFRKSLRNFLLKNVLFKLAARFLYIGVQNRLFYKHFEVADEKLIFTPFCVDNERFQAEAEKLLPEKKKLRAELGLPTDSFIVLFSGKYIAVKRPLDLLRALADLSHLNGAVVFVGEGHLRGEMENFIRANNLGERAILTGFVNQSIISQYYASADAFVLCSDKETWGLSTNEAMNFSLPIILSDQVGSSYDLVEEGKNGFTFPCGDVSALTEKIEFLANLSEPARKEMGAVSLKKISEYSFSAIVAGLQKI
jgi:glycosyltransferase involved in cell wall biosynthesis